MRYDGLRELKVRRIKGSRHLYFRHLYFAHRHYCVALKMMGRWPWGEFLLCGVKGHGGDARGKKSVPSISIGARVKVL
jgi:hypothetical protein